MDNDKCRVFVPSKTKGKTRKRSTSRSAPLEHASELRRQIYRERWTVVEKQLQAVFAATFEATINEALEFLDDEAKALRDRNVIPTALVSTGPSLTSRIGFFERFVEKTTQRNDSIVITLDSGSCLNLKAVLREVTRGAEAGADSVEDANDSSAGPRLFDYDLELLRQSHAKRRSDHVIVLFRDCEAFDTTAFVQAVDIFHSWLDRIPFTLVFGLGTSSDSFQARLPASTLRILRGQEFSLEDASDTLEQVFAQLIDAPQSPLFIGPELGARLIRNQLDHVQSLERLFDAIKYAYMSHFYANTLSLFLHDAIKYKEVPREVFEGLRNLPSYRRWAEQRLDDGDVEAVRRSLNSDSDLFELVVKSLETTLELIKQLAAATLLLSNLRRALQKTATPITRSTLYVQAMSGDISDSPIVRETLLALRKAPSDLMAETLHKLHSVGGDALPIDVDTYAEDLNKLLSKKPAADGPLRSQHDSRNDNFKTTIVGQKVQLSKHQKVVSGLDAEYSSFVEKFHHEISDYFAPAFIDPKQLFLHELLIYDLKSPHTDVFQPRPRFAIERALHSPHDYLNCDCCPSNSARHPGEDNTLAPTQPATSIIYQLYLESGSLINAADLFAAFHAIVGQPEQEEEQETAQSKAQFQRALAELKYLGMVRPTKKKANHIAKSMWRGL